jgi:dienelactone hydrolase
VNYRGYGASEGQPSQAAIVSDAEAIHDWAIRQPGIDARRVALHGRSLGAGVAVQLAARRPVGAVVLTSPFTSAADVGAQAYPWLPVRWLIRHPFDSAARAPAVKAPLLVLYGDEDDLIPPAMSRRLAGLWGGPAEARAVRGGHNDLRMDAGHDEAMREFLSRH